MIIKEIIFLNGACSRKGNGLFCFFALGLTLWVLRSRSYAMPHALHALCEKLGTVERGRESVNRT